MPQGEKVGLIKVRLYRPFAGEGWWRPFPAPPKESPCSTAPRNPAQRANRCTRTSSRPLRKLLPAARFKSIPLIVGGRYGLGSKEFNAGDGQGGVFDNLAADQPQEPLHRRHHRRRDPYQPGLGSRISPPKRTACTARCSSAWARMARSARTRTRSRSSAKGTDNYAQGYFVYDSKKSGACTISHLRFGSKPDPQPLPDRAGRFRGVP